MAATAAATEVHTIAVEAVTPESFAEFGNVLTVDGQERLPIGIYPGIDVFRPALIQADTDIEWLLQRTSIREFRLLFLERHRHLSQAFIPLAGAPFISILAPAQAREKDGFPAFGEIRAFLVTGDRGIQINAGVWHEPPFAVVDNSLQLTTSHQALTKGLGAKLNGSREIAELDVEKRNLTERTGKVVRIAFA